MKLIKKAVGIGNGAAVYVPKEYKGKQVLVVLPEGKKELKKRILNELVEYGENILGVYIFGSYARGEQVVDSDVDVLVIMKDGEEKKGVKNALEEFDARVFSLEDLKENIKRFPLFIMPILLEAEVVFNPLLLEELKQSNIDFSRFKWHFGDSRRIIKIIKKFIDLDGEGISVSHIYSLVLRLRACYMIECLLRNKRHSNSGLRERLLSFGFSDGDVKWMLGVYRDVRDDRDVVGNVQREKIEKFIGVLERYLKKVENETKKKIGKGN
jgi:predicted nucleotidyltransferase